MRNISQIYEHTYGQNIESKDYYLASIKFVDNKNIFISIDTHWVGQHEQHEVRKINHVNPDATRKMFDFIGYPLAVIRDSDEFFSLLNIGGHVLISEDLMHEHWSEILQPKVVVKTYERGYVDYNMFASQHKQRFAKSSYRMSIFRRDNFRCRICGVCENDNIHVRLEVHHIKPWEEGGLSDPENLITLCSLCHSGINVVDREYLYKKIGISFPLEKHELYKLNNSWNEDQYFRYVSLLSNAVTLRVDIPK